MAIRLAALRFFYTKALKKGWSIAETPYPKKDHRLPAILSQEEVAQLIDAASTLFHRTLLMTLYATGTRNAELTRLKFSDVDSKRMATLTCSWTAGNAKSFRSITHGAHSTTFVAGEEPERIYTRDPPKRVWRAFAS